MPIGLPRRAAHAHRTPYTVVAAAPIFDVGLRSAGTSYHSPALPIGAAYAA